MQAGDAAVVIVVLVVAVPDGRRPDQLARQTVTVWTTVVAVHTVACHRHTATTRRPSRRRRRISRLVELFVAAVTHTHTRARAFSGPLSGTGCAGTRKAKRVWILLKQETVSGSGISWAICKLAPRPRQNKHASTPPLSFLQAGCSFCRPTRQPTATKPP